MNEDYHSLGVEAMNYIRGLRSRLNKVRKDLYYGSSPLTCADNLQLILEDMDMEYQELIVGDE
tara:strand:- start:387 stop:575 length:189 start_codon:yes stop_codon:yes gene_type:complete